MDTIERTEIPITSPTRLLTPAVTVILVLMLIGFVLAVYAPNFTLNNLSLVADYVIQGKVWEILTYTLINGNPFGLIFNGLVVLFIGGMIEREWGTKSFVILWIVTGVACALIWMIISLFAGKLWPGTGSDACVYGIIAAFGVLYRGRRMWFYFFTIEAQVIAIIFIVIGLVISIVQPLNLIWVSGALVAYIYVKLRLRMTLQRTTKAFQAKRDVSDGFVDID